MNARNECHSNVVPIQVPLTVLLYKRLQLAARSASRASATMPRGALNLSGSQVLLGFAGLLSLFGLMLWAMFNLWLFEP